MVFLLLAVVATVVVFMLVTAASSSDGQSNTIDRRTISTNSTNEQRDQSPLVESAEPELDEIATGTPVSDIPLTEGQKDVLDTLGVNTESFVITPAMINCAESRLSKERVNEITSGATPTLLETARLSTCLSAE